MTEEKKNFIKNNLVEFFNKMYEVGYYVEYRYQSYKTFEEFKQANLTYLINSIIDTDSFYNLEFGLNDIKSHENRLVMNKMGFPFDMPFSCFLKSYKTDILTKENMINIENIYIENINKLKNVDMEIYYEKYGTDTFLERFKDFSKTVINYINQSNRKFKVENYEFSNKSGKCICNIIMDYECDYQQKNTILKKTYKKLRDNVFHGNIPYTFKFGFNCKRKTSPSNNLIIEIKANDYQAMGMDEMTEFVPKMMSL